MSVLDSVNRTKKNSNYYDIFFFWKMFIRQKKQKKKLMLFNKTNFKIVSVKHVTIAQNRVNTKDKDRKRK